MDTVDAIRAAIGFSLLSFCAVRLLLVQNFTKGIETLRRVLRESRVFQHILEECDEIVQSQSPLAPLPQAVVRTLWLCHGDRLRLQRILDGIYRKKGLLGQARQTLSFAIHHQELMASYHSFRDSVFLLRDLCLGLRLNRQLLQVSAEIARLLLDTDDLESDEEQQVASNERKASTTNIDESPRTHRDNTPRQEGEQKESSRPKKRLERFLKDVARLLGADFTRDLIVILETNSSEPHERFQYVPLRNKIDTYSDASFISHEVLEEYRVREDAIRAIPEGEQQDREFELLGRYKLKPKREITLDWYRPKETQKRQTTFIVAENNPPFDTLIGKKDWDREMPQSANVVFGRRKTKAQRKVEAEKEMEQEETARELVRRELEELEKLEVQRKNAASSVSPATSR